MNSRISLVIRTKNITPSQLADELGVQRSGISHIINGRNKPSLDFIQRLIKRYPDISMTWLMFGEGPMMNPYVVKEELKSEERKATNLQSTIIDLFPPLGEIAANNSIPEGLTMPVTRDNTDENHEVTKNSVITEQSNQKNNTSTNQNTNEVTPNVNFENQISRGSHDSAPGKEVKRIVIFYSDKSFEEYFPEEG